MIHIAGQAGGTGSSGEEGDGKEVTSGQTREQRRRRELFVFVKDRLHSIME